MSFLTFGSKRYVRNVFRSLRSPPLSRHLSLAVPGQRPYRVLFFGTDDVSLATLKALYNNSKNKQRGDCLVETIEVVCPSDRPMNSCKKDDLVPVKKFAQCHGLRVYETPSHLKSLKTWDFPVMAKFDLGVVVSFGYFLHPNMLKNLYFGAINMHPSMLPKYRGPAPIPHALLNGDTTTGISVIEIDLTAFDVGRILLQEPYDIRPGIQCQELAQELAVFGADCVMKTLDDLSTRKKKAAVQDDAHASKAPKLTLKDGLISFRDSATDIFHRWQALSNSVGIRVKFREKIVKLIEVRLPSNKELQSVQINESHTGPATSGTFFFEKKRQVLWVRCADDSWLLVSRLQQADRKVGTALDFCNGYRLKNLQREQFEDVMTTLLKKWQ